MSGVEFLERAVPIFPNARKVLLTAYADTEAEYRADRDVVVIGGANSAAQGILHLSK